MLLTIHDANLEKIGWVDNEKQDTLNYFDDTWTRDLFSGSSVFEFTVVKKELKTDVGRDYFFEQLNERAFVSFEYKGKDYVFNIMETEENETTIRCYCENLNLELINEFSQPYEASQAMTFVDYCKAMDLLNYTMLTIGRNEIKGKKLLLAFSQQETKLARLLALAKEFEAEIEFRTYLNPDSTIRSFKLNVYHAHDDQFQGVGTKRDDLVLRYGKNLKSVTRKISKANLFNTVVPVGKRSDATKTKRTVVVNPDGTETITEKVSTSDGGYTTTTTITDKNGKVLSTKKIVATKNSDGSLTKSTSSNASGSTVTYNDTSKEVKNKDGTITKTKTRSYSDGRKEVTTVHTKVEKLPNKVVRTTTTTTKPDGSVTQRVSTKYSNGTTSTDSKVIKAGTSKNSTTTSKVDSASDAEFDLSDMKDWKIKNDNGVVEFYKRGVALYAPLSMQLYPAAFTSDTMKDQWTRRDIELEADSEEELSAKAYQYLKEHCYPAITYTVDGFIDGEIGDTIQIVDEGFMETMFLSARITKQVISFSNPTNNKTEVSNVQAIESKLSQGIQNRLDQMIEEAKPYTIQVVTDSGVIFKNNTGSTLVTPILSKGVREYPDATWRFILNDNEIVGQTLLVDAAQVKGTQLLTIMAYIGNDEVASHQISLVNVEDGQDGAQGIPGKPGADGRTPYFHRAWANSADGRTDFSTSDSTNKRYLGTLTDFVEADSQDPTKYKWTALFDNVQVGGVNLLKNSGSLPNPGTYLNGNWSAASGGDGRVEFFNVTNPPAPGITAGGRVTGNTTGNKDVSQSNIPYIVNDTYTISCYARVPATSASTEVTLLMRCWMNGNSRNRELRTKISNTEWQRYHFTFVADGTLGSAQAGISGLGDIEVCGFQLEGGNVPSSWSQSQYDTDQVLSSKADQALTQTQITELREANELLEQEIQARLSQQALIDWAEEYDKIVSAATAEAKTKAEEALKKSAERLAEITKLGEKAQKWETTTGYIQADDDGLSIAKDGSDTKFIVTNDVISFVSGGKAVMTLTQGELKVDNGVFALSVRVGRFVEAPLESNPDINVIRYVGEVN